LLIISAILAYSYYLYLQ